MSTNLSTNFHEDSLSSTYVNIFDYKKQKTIESNTNSETQIIDFEETYQRIANSKLDILKINIDIVKNKENEIRNRIKNILKD